MSLPFRLLVIGAWVVAILCASLMTWGQACPRPHGEMRPAGQASQPAWITGLSADWDSDGPDAEDRRASRAAADASGWSSQPRRLDEVFSRNPTQLVSGRVASRSRNPDVELPPWVAATLALPDSDQGSGLPVLNAGFEDGATESGEGQGGVEVPPPADDRRARIQAQLADIRERNARAASVERRPVAPRDASPRETTPLGDEAIAADARDDALETPPFEQPAFEDAAVVEQPEGTPDATFREAELKRIHRLEAALVAIKTQVKATPSKPPEPKPDAPPATVAVGAAVLPEPHHDPSGSTTVAVDIPPVEAPAPENAPATAPIGPDPGRIARIEAALAAVKTRVIQKPATPPAAIAPERAETETAPIDDGTPIDRPGPRDMQTPSGDVAAAPEAIEPSGKVRVARIGAALDSIRKFKETAPPAASAGRTPPRVVSPNQTASPATAPETGSAPKSGPSPQPAASGGEPPHVDRAARLQAELAAMENQKRRAAEAKKPTPEASKARPDAGTTRPQRVVPASATGHAAPQSPQPARVTTGGDSDARIAAQIDRLEQEIVGMQRQLDALAAARNPPPVVHHVYVPQRGKSRSKGLFADLPLFGRGHSKPHHTQSIRPATPMPAVGRPSAPSYPNVLSQGEPSGRTGEARLPSRN